MARLARAQIALTLRASFVSGGSGPVFMRPSSRAQSSSSAASMMASRHSRTVLKPASRAGPSAARTHRRGKGTGSCWFSSSFVASAAETLASMTLKRASAAEVMATSAPRRLSASLRASEEAVRATYRVASATSLEGHNARP